MLVAASNNSTAYEPDEAAQKKVSEHFSCLVLKELLVDVDGGVDDVSPSKQEEPGRREKHVVELDGRNAFPIDHGRLEGIDKENVTDARAVSLAFLKKCADVIRTHYMMPAGPEEGRFSLMALVRDKRC